MVSPAYRQAIGVLLAPPPPEYNTTADALAMDSLRSVQVAPQADISVESRRRDALDNVESDVRHWMQHNIHERSSDLGVGSV
ncbi:hypothetical protein GQ600_14703 [Phytophthora cactorum]|nr:hypothetical protein GQ600_14703 [Phytophthora cactorum]